MTAAALEPVLEDGVLTMRRGVGDLVLEELVCPPGHRFAAWEPDSPYVALVLEGSMVKRFGALRRPLRAGTAIGIPVSAMHETRFSGFPTRVLKINAGLRGGDGASSASLLHDLVQLEDEAVAELGRRLGAELHARDAAADLALEGLALETLAAVARRTADARRVRRPPAWVTAARDLLEASADVPPLGEVAAAVGVHPSHLARTFRATYGLTVGEYARRLRLDRARRLLASTDTPLALVAAEAGFVDQSHFTRAFRVYAGVTPGRYRAARRS